LMMFGKAIEEGVTNLDPDLPALPEADPAGPDGEGWLFDSRRDYTEQLLHYKTPKERERMEADMRSRQKVCPWCRTHFVSKKKSGVYCTPKCRLRDHRKKKREARR
jgi:hypothetical protein